ncbi:MAG TPA: CAP domain-containing protein [Halanaerobiales bacterium]|nr:CAP domain-containing protein [Halanaerobiales bacterium]
MKFYNTRLIAALLIMFLILNSMACGLTGLQRVQAGIWDEYGGGILTVVKGLVILWIINLMQRNATGDGNDDFLTSTIKKGLNLDDTENHNQEEYSNEEDSNYSETPEIAEVHGLREDEQLMIKLINESRKEKGLRELEIDMELVRIARNKAIDMQANDYLEHVSPNYGSPFDMLEEAGVAYSLAGENLAASTDANKAFKALMESSEHRDNIFNSRYDRVGVGIAGNSVNGLKIVQLFIDSPDPAQ